MTTSNTERGIRCGSCRRRHDSVDRVRDCYAQAQHDEEQAKAEQAAELATERWYEERGGAEYDPIEQALWADEDAEAAARLDAMSGSRGRDMASPKQVKYIMDLFAQHEWPDTLTQSSVENMERRQVSKLIEALKSSPLRPDQREAVPEVPAGRYALLRDGQWRFYQVDVPDKGRWEGKMFLKSLIGSPGDWRKDNLYGSIRGVVLRSIAGDVQQAMVDFGLQSGYCGRCGSPLSDPDSIARGLGPICVSKMGW